MGHSGTIVFAYGEKVRQKKLKYSKSMELLLQKIYQLWEKPLKIYLVNLKELNFLKL